MDYHLLVLRGRSASESLKLMDGVTTVGRHDSCQIRIKSSQVSRKHCELFEKKGLLMVKDLGSSNGTFVNGKKVKTQQILEPGDELTIGSVSLRVAKVGQELPAKAAKGVASDTAVVAAVSNAAPEDDFEIDFDDEPSIEIEPDAPIELDDEPATTVPPPRVTTPAPAAKAAPAPATKVATTPSPSLPADSPEAADEAIADFLLDIKLDEED